MFVIITYDVGEKRVGKVCKKLREYLDWTQNSVFEGEITIGKYTQCMADLSNIVDKDTDSIYVYEVKNPRNIKKVIHGREKNPFDLFL
ncbi:CRISPR-associated endonuclease Cas2 [Cytobacillus oceanisediminis]|uniref:CRISPR-associated endoribonuclease Cas2 n=1 Tax=Niallia alba TaxID=2729105 RepID=A0A7Y0K785_9BACI|nr:MULTISPECIES: CRISPR-associated endonuclease Cas2 [Bacillaceae]MBZ9536440.1 CRISPR-associated endonuclease Cas2 [Cytobacillus oceanisediminis]NMO76976.1 CRISPR-associated endonuclease Cas2 [Niallia alba]